MPDDLYETMRLRVNNAPYRQTTDFEGYRELILGSRSLRARGVFYVGQEAGDLTPQYLVFPIPIGGEPIRVEYVARPANMVIGTAEPPTPPTFHRAIVDYAKAVAYGSVEDNSDLDTYYRGQFADAVAALRALRLTRESIPSDVVRVAGEE